MILMAEAKKGFSKDGRLMHYSVGAIIKKDKKYLLIDRATEPFGFAGIAGHVDVGENPEQALVREVKEESGLTVVRYALITERLFDRNKCSNGVNVHYWYLYMCGVTGDLEWNKREAKSIGYHTLEQMRELKLELVWKYWFKDVLHII